MMSLQSDCGGRDRLKGNVASVVVEANFKPVEYSGVAEKIKPDAEALRETNRDGNRRAADFDRDIMNEDRNETAVADDHHLQPATLPVDSHISGLSSIDHAEGGPRIHVDPYFMILDRDRDDRHQVAFVKRVREFDSRHTISSSLGTFSTDGIFLGSTSRALVSTSRRESPTATRVSFTTATYLPAYFVTSSLKCSTTHRSSLSMIIVIGGVRITFHITIGGRLDVSQWRHRILPVSVRKLPAIYGREEFVEDGGLLNYSASIIDLTRRSATYVDKILKGTKPADLPVEQPMKFELVINLKAAKQIGLTIPPNVLARADKVIR
jgi:hypothetical protein